MDCQAIFASIYHTASHPAKEFRRVPRIESDTPGYDSDMTPLRLEPHPVPTQSVTSLTTTTQNPISPPCPSLRAHHSKPSARWATSTPKPSRATSEHSRRSCKPPRPARGYSTPPIPRRRRLLRARRGSSVERTSRGSPSLLLRSGLRGLRGLMGIIRVRLQSPRKESRPLPRPFHSTSLRHLTPSPPSPLPIRKRRRRRSAPPPPPR